MHWHLRAGQPDGNGFTVLFHISIPAANNRVGFSYQTALVNSGLGGKTAMQSGTAADQITAAELAQIQAGQIYEYSLLVPTNPGETTAQYAARLDALYTSLASTTGPLIAELKNQLQGWGGQSSS